MAVELLYRCNNLLRFDFPIEIIYLEKIPYRNVYSIFAYIQAKGGHLSPMVLPQTFADGSVKYHMIGGIVVGLAAIYFFKKALHWNPLCKTHIYILGCGATVAP
jgi:hypothetical protein